MDGTWVYPLLAEAMAVVRLQEVETYIYQHHNTVAQYIDNRPIMYLCLALEQGPGTIVSKRLWDQKSLYPEWMNIVAREEGPEEEKGEESKV